jgi:transcription termination factor Rho
MAETMERSVLESKERGELAVIAGAIGIKVAPRLGKDKIIDAILTSAGIGTSPAPKASKAPATAAADSSGDASAPAERPRRGRPKKNSGGEALSFDDAPVAETPAVQASEATEPRTNDRGRNDRGDRSDRGDRPERGDRPDRGANRDRVITSGRPPRGGAPVQASFDPFADAPTSTSKYDPAEEEWAFAAAKAPRDTPVATPNLGDEGADGAEGNGYPPRRERNRGRNRDRFERGDRPERTDRPEGAPTGAEAGAGEPRADRGPRPDRFERGDRPDRGPRPERVEGEARPDRPDRGPRPDRFERGERPPRGDRPDRPDRPERNRDGGGQGGQGGFKQGFGKAEGDGFGFGEGRNKRRRGKDRDRLVTAERDGAIDRLSENYQGELIDVEGLLDLSDQGYGYIRVKGYLPSPGDIYVPVNKVRQLGLRKGDKIVGKHRPATPQEKFPAIVSVETCNGHNLEIARLRPKFDDLTPLFPDVKLRLEQPGQPGNMVARIIDLVSPIGKGQRGLIVSPPKAGKTTVMKQIATSIEANNPDVHLMVLLIDERPEEVTDMRRHVRGEVVASTFDRPSDEHTMIAELALDRAKRLVEEGKDVVIILDGITRLARAYNLAAPATGRIMSGGIDTGALYPPKKFFGAARNIEEGGSLTILATALVETGSTMDTVIFEEFKGTGNMELRLDRRLAEKRVYPAINVNESSTRHEELLFDKAELDVVWKLRRVLNGLGEGGSAAAALELLMDRIKTTRSNAEFLMEIAKAPSVSG